MELAFLVSLVIFIIQIVTILIAGFLLYFFHAANIVPLKNGMIPEYLNPVFYLIAVSIVGGLIALLLTMKISASPVFFVIRKIEQLASGDFTVRLQFKSPLSRNPVLEEFADSFNKMACELEKTEMLREDFVNNFSHEFKTPIVSIAGFAAVLRRGNLPDEEREQYLAVIEEEAMRLAALATNILSLTKVENQSILTDISDYNLSEQIRSCILLLADKWEDKGLDFKLDFREYRIEANEELLKQVWINLIDNAIKFSPAGGTVEVGIRSARGQVTVIIINAGTEIAEDDRTRIFHKFYQADRSRSTQGNGIGLAVVKQVVSLHHGEVSVQSENGLTMFAVQLPQRQ